MAKARARAKRVRGNFRVIAAALQCLTLLFLLAKQGQAAYAKDGSLILQLVSGKIEAAHDLIEIQPASRWNGDVLDAAASRQTAEVVLEPADKQVDLVLTNGTTFYEHSYVFRAENGKSLSDYNVVPMSSNAEVLSRDDISFETLDNGDNTYNITTEYEFSRSVGQTDISFNFEDKTSGQIISSGTSKFTVGGMSFFYTYSNGTRVQVGAGYGNLQLDYAEIQENDQIFLETYVQYLDGSTSREKLTAALDTVVISVENLDGQIQFNQNCEVDGGIYDGSSLSLPAGCGVGFSKNDVDGQYVGPYLGIDFEGGASGSFIFGFDYEQLVIGSDLESEGFETFLGVDIVGGMYISEMSPSSVSTLGGEVITISGTFPGFDINSDSSFITIGTTTISKNLITSVSETEIVISVPPQSELSGGQSGDYDLVIHAGGDQSQASSLTYTNSGSRITSLSPNSGINKGGTTITATGNFIDFDINSESSYIVIGTTVIDKSLIISATDTQIVFSSPPETDVSGGSDGGVYGLTIVANGVTSNSQQFTFTEPGISVISSMSPNFGSQDGGVETTLTGTFENFDLNSDTSYITFGTTVVDKSLITSASDTTIVFTSPPEESLSGGSNGFFDVTVTSSEVTSLPARYTYTGDVFITQISPSSGAMEGGTTVVLTGSFPGFDPDSEGSRVTVGGQTMAIVSGSSTQITFETPPHSDFDSVPDFRLPVVVTIEGGASNSVEFVYEAPVIITNISPSSGSEDGGTTVTLDGQFVNFDPATSAVLYGGKKIDGSLIVSFTDAQIVYTTPPREELGSTFSYDVSVLIGDQVGEPLEFTYQATGFFAEFDSSGGALNTTTGFYDIGLCGNSVFRASIPSSALAQNASFAWSLVDSNGDSALNDFTGATDSQVLYLPYAFLEIVGEQYTLTVTVTTTYFTTSSQQILIRFAGQSLGVSIAVPKSVSYSEPNTTLLIPADIGVPGCRKTAAFDIDAEDITYVWSFRGEKFVFSHLNSTVDEDVVGPTLLGREFKIPQEFMLYGSYVLRLKAFYTANESISGSGAALIRIIPADLVSIINAGQIQAQISQEADVLITGENSRDPDVLAGGDPSADLSYSWSCRFGWKSDLSDALDCDGTFLNNTSEASFTVSKSLLSRYRNTTDTFIEYSLNVSKTSPAGRDDDDQSDATITRTSSTVSASLVLSAEEDALFESLSKIDVYDNQSAPTDPSKVKYYQDVIIEPISVSEETTWVFSLVEPRSEITLLLVQSNLKSGVGFWEAGDSAGRKKLGIAANKLKPGTDYKFSITTSRPGLSENEEIVSLSTVNRPTVQISKLPMSSGTTNDTYVVSAFTNYDGDFKFYFTLTDDYGFKSCVDGCQGTSLVRFRVLSAGIYQLDVAVFDSLGHTQLASATSATNITIISELGDGNSLDIFTDYVNTTFVSGDHADFQQAGLDLVKYIISQGSSASPEKDSEIIANYTENFNQIVANAVPTSEQSDGFVNTASALTTLFQYNISFSTETLYYLTNITVNAVTRSPDNVALTQLDSLLAFYGSTPEMVLANGPGGTTRTRLRQGEADPVDNSQYNVLLADYYEVMKSLIGVVALKPSSCGFTRQVSTGDIRGAQLALSARHGSAVRQSETDSTPEDEEIKTVAARYSNIEDTKLFNSNWAVGKICTPEQGLELQLLTKGRAGEVSGAGRFSWCEELFEEQFKELYFMIVQTPNYVYLSELRQNVTLGTGLHSAYIGAISANNTFTEEAMPLEKCYGMDIPIPTAVTVTEDGLSKEEERAQYPSPLQITDPKPWAEDEFDFRRYYLAKFSNAEVTYEAREGDESTSFASFEIPAPGIYTVATRMAWDGGLFSLDGYRLTAVEIAGTTLSVLLLIAFAALATWLVSTRLTAFAAAAPPVEADFTYVERDVYGRGTAIEMMDAQDSGQMFNS